MGIVSHRLFIAHTQSMRIHTTDEEGMCALTLVICIGMFTSSACASAQDCTE